MRATQRVEINTAIPFVQAYRSCLGITSVESYIYVFYSNKIRVYQQFPQKLAPQLSEERLISQRKILLYAVSKDFIAMLFEDSKLEVRSRQHWELVQYSLTLQQRASQVNRLQIKGQKIIYRYLDELSKLHTYGFVTINIKSNYTLMEAQTVYWTQAAQFDQLIHMRQLGSIGYFYLGLLNNEIKFGMYYGTDNGNNLKQFQFGTIKQDRNKNNILAFSMLNVQKYHQTLKNLKQIIYLVKLIQSQTKPKQQIKRYLFIQYRKFYEDVDSERPEDVPRQNCHPQTKRLQTYTKMMHTLQQIQANTNCIKSQFFNENLPIQNKQQKSKESQNVNFQQTVKLQLSAEQFYENTIQSQNKLYIATNKKIYLFQIYHNQETNREQSRIKQLTKLEKGAKLIQVSENKLYITMQSLYIYGLMQLQKENGSGSIQQIKRKNCKNQQMQTETISDVLLDQIEEKQMKQMIDQLLQKRQVRDVETQTQVQYQIQQNKKTDKQVNKLRQNKYFNQISVGGNLPICPENHQQILQKINKNLDSIQNKFHKQTSLKVQETFKKQQQKFKTQISKKVDELISSAINSTVTPLVQANVRQVFQTKLQQVNLYIYSLIMENLLLLKQEIQKDEVKQNMLRSELIQKQLHQVSLSKKAVAQMVDICKARQMQKVAFFEQIKKKFLQMENKVLLLEQKVKSLLEYQQTNQSKFLDEIEVIKIMIKNQDPQFQQKRKLSMLSHQKSARRISVDTEKHSSGDSQHDEEIEEESEQNQSQADFSSDSKIVILRRNLIPSQGTLQKYGPYPPPNPYYHHPPYPQYANYYPPQPTPPPHIYSQYAPYQPFLNTHQYDHNYYHMPLVPQPFPNISHEAINSHVIKRHAKFQNEVQPRKRQKQMKKEQVKIKNKKRN